jgi:hypothetical protein
MVIPVRIGLQCSSMGEKLRQRGWTAEVSCMMHIIWPCDRWKSKRVTYLYNISNVTVDCGRKETRYFLVKNQTRIRKLDINTLRPAEET